MEYNRTFLRSKEKNKCNLQKNIDLLDQQLLNQFYFNKILNKKNIKKMKTMTIKFNNISEIVHKCNNRNKKQMLIIALIMIRK